MDDRVIEPSEILVEGGSRPKGEPERANPWLRFLGRFFDYALFFLLLMGLRKFFHGTFPFGKYERLVPFEFFVWIPFEALLLSTLGTTPGKFLLGTQLKAPGRRQKLEFVSALRRSLSVWFRGLGMGIPFINIICLLVAYNRLKLFKITSWDRDDHLSVTHHPIGRWRIIFAALVAIFGLLFYYSDKNQTIKWQKHQTTSFLIHP